MTDKITDEMIMALVDGQLPAAEADRVLSAVLASSEMRAKFDIFKESQSLLADGFGGLLQRPVPVIMEQLVLGPPAGRSGVTSLADARAKRKPPGRFDFLKQVAAAAVLVSAAALAGYEAGQAGPKESEVVLAGLLPGGSPLEAALNEAPAGTSVEIDETKFVAVATYQIDGGQVCREFELSNAGSGTVALACRSAGGWQIELAALNANAGASGQFLPASADAFELVGAALDAKGPYEGVDLAEEACVLDARNCAPAR